LDDWPVLGYIYILGYIFKNTALTLQDSNYHLSVFAGKMLRSVKHRGHQSLQYRLLTVIMFFVYCYVRNASLNRLQLYA